MYIHKEDRNIFSKLYKATDKKPHTVKFDEHTAQMIATFEDGSLWMGEFIVKQEENESLDISVDGHFI